MWQNKRHWKLRGNSIGKRSSIWPQSTTHKEKEVRHYMNSETLWMKRKKIKIKKLKAWEKTGKSALDHIENSEISGVRNNLKENGQRPEGKHRTHLKWQFPLRTVLTQLEATKKELAHLCTHVYVWCNSTPRFSGNNVALIQTVLSLGKMHMKSEKAYESLPQTRHQINHKLSFIKYYIKSHVILT